MACFLSNLLTYSVKIYFLPYCEYKTAKLDKLIRFISGKERLTFVKDKTVLNFQIQIKLKEQFMPFKTLDFQYSWRPYQLRVLNAIKALLDDNRLHIVAAPGAGKTTLGLEVFRLLAKKTLVLSPTRVIRDQWVDRLKDFTTENVSDLAWISKSIHDPKVLTSVTYQALHAQFSEELENVEAEELADFDENDSLKGGGINNFIKTVEEHKIEVLILDEAHHLKAEWWRAIEKVCSHFPDIVLVALTATPPYDSQKHEWSRYEQLCGPIDEEISIPELVKASTLCPHQDFVWACNTTKKESKLVNEYDDKVRKLCQSLFQNEGFLQVVSSHPWVHGNIVEQDILKEPDVAISIISYLHAKQLTVNGRFLQHLDLTLSDIPEFGRHWWQVLVESVLFSKKYPQNETNVTFIKQLKKELRAAELLKKRELSIEHSKFIERSLAISSAKVFACSEIHQREYEMRQDDLCQVILTDYIRDEFLVSDINCVDSEDLSLGAYPVFKQLTTTTKIPEKIGLLTGRLAVIPDRLEKSILKLISSSNVTVTSMSQLEGYKKISAPLNQLTVAFTELLVNGELKTLVGTRSLLGEGWDAPTINSLILASTVGSFMLTNQMRGRAIRRVSSNPEKVSSIWHLVAINGKSESGWRDYHNLKKRFNTFVGLSEYSLIIESGFERIENKQLKFRCSLATDIPSCSVKSSISENNMEMIQRLTNLPKIKTRWQTALNAESRGRVLPSVKSDTLPELRGYMLKNTFKYLMTQLLIALFAGLQFALYSAGNSLSDLMVLLFVVTLGILVYKLPTTLSCLNILIGYLPVDGALRQIGNALREAMHDADFISCSQAGTYVNLSKLADGSCYLALTGGTFYESSLFADCMSEILSPIDSPRYMISRTGKFAGFLRTDYHSVPTRFGVKKELAEIFCESWERYVGKCELIYTRSKEGRSKMLKAKMRAFSSNFREKVSRQDRWN